MQTFNTKIDGVSTTIGVVVPSVTTAKPVKTLTDIHHVLLMDGSGSMYPHAGQVVTSVKNIVGALPDGDKFTLIQFRGVDDYTVHMLRASCDDSALQYIDKLSRVGGTTCFSSPVNHTVEISNNSVVDENMVVHLFTDGEPVVPWSDEDELQRVLTSLDSISSKLLAVNTYGFGSYYSESIMNAVSTHYPSSTFTHLSSCDNKFSEAMIRNAAANRALISGSTIELSGDNVIRVSVDNVMFGSSGNHRYVDGDMFVVVNPTEVSQDAPTKEHQVTALYALSAMYMQSGDGYKARELLQHNIKDKHLVEVVEDAFTKEERYTATRELIAATTTVSKRWVSGLTGVVSARNAVSVYALLNTLRDIKFDIIPYHEEASEYKRVGRSADKSKSAFIKAEDEICTSLSRLVWNSKRANLSVGFTVPGSVAVSASDAAIYGVEKIPTYIHRNHTIIKDGVLNMERIVVRHHPDAADELVQLIPHAAEFINETDVLIKLNRLPLMSSTDVDANILKGSVIYQLCESLYSRQVESKVLRKLINNDSSVQKPNPLAALHDLYGIQSDGSYREESGSTALTGDEDYYTAREFTFTLKGCSAVPKVETKAGSKAYSQILMNEAIGKYSGLDTELLEGLLDANKAMQKVLADRLALVRLYMVVTKKPIQGVSIVDGNEVIIKSTDDPVLIIKTERTKVYI